jgi:antitoxin (DNA-binding transcriptional repressor) of toxin-antitoxin stability system
MARCSYNALMTTHSLVEAKSRLSDLIDRAQQGEAVVITRHGKPVAELRALRAPGRAMTHADLEWLDQHRVPRRNSVEDAGALVSRMRDDEER